MADTFTWIFRFIHVLAGVMWLGGNFLWAMIVAPNILQRGPPAIRRPFLEATLAKLTRYMIIAGALTILSGLVVMGLITGWDNIVPTFQGAGGYPPQYGIALGVGFFAAIAFYVVGLFVIKPTGAKLLETMQRIPAPAPGAPPSPPPADVQAELGRLGKKMGMASLAGMLLGTLALGAMVWAVNVVR